MSFVSSLYRPDTRKNAIDSGSPLADMIVPSASGVSVTTKTALQVTTVFDCLRVIAEGLAQVPLKIYKSDSEGSKEPAIDHALYDLLCPKPNEWQTSFEFRENLIFQAGLLGNFYAFKNIVRGKIASIVPFEPNTVTLKVDDRRKLSYDVNLANGEQKTFPAELIWHVRGPAWETHTGMRAVEYAREAIGLAINIERAQNTLHANGVQTSGTYSVEGTLSADQHKTLSDWVFKHIGGFNKFKPLILDRSAKFHPNSMTGVVAQTIENRRFQIEEICRAFRVMPLMIGQADKAATYASAEQMFLAHVVHTLSPWYTRLEQSIDANLLTKKERTDGFYSKFNANGLMRGASKDRAEFYTKMASIGALSPNEVRDLEEMNPYKDGDKYFHPSNFVFMKDGETKQENGAN